MSLGWLSVIIVSVGIAATGIVLAWVVARSEMRRRLGGGARKDSEEMSVVMPRDGAIIFRDIVGKLAVLRITCDKCERSGQYRVDRLIMRYGIDAKPFDRSDEITVPVSRRRI